MSELVGAWKDRKRAQADRFMRLDPSLSLEKCLDYGTTFALMHPVGGYLVIGRLPGAPTGEAVDLDDAAIGEWHQPLRKPQ